MIDKIIAIQNCGPSGTLLLQSLLDNHPQILSLPGLHGQQLLIMWENLHTLSTDELLHQFVQENDYWFNVEKQPGEDLGLASMGQNMDEKAGINKQKFIDIFNELTAGKATLSRKEFIQVIFLAYNKALGKDTDQAEYILYPIHCLPKKYASQLIEDFSIVRFLHTIRNSVQSMGSMAKHINHNSAWNHLNLLSCVTSQMLNDFTIHAGPHFAYGMHPYFADKPDNSVLSRAVRLEDIHKDLTQTMSAIVKWLDIDWNDCLLVSTFDGKLWNNRPNSIRQSGVGHKIIGQSHQDILSDFDKFRLEILSTPYLIHFKYKQKLTILEKLTRLLMPLLVYLPFKMEHPISDIRSDYQKLGVGAERKVSIRTSYGWLGLKLCNKMLRSRLIDLIIVSNYNINEYIGCRFKQMLPALFRRSNKNDFVKLLSPEY